MSEKDAFADLRRAKESEFFAKRERELIEKLRRRVNLEAELRKMLASRDAANEEILQELEGLGFRRATLPLLHLVPLIYVAWAEGFVTEKERKRILEIARIRGVKEGSLADEQLQEWLSERPAEDFFENCFSIIRTFLEALPEEQEEAVKRDLVWYATRVASASGGLLGFWGAISNEEQAAIDHITTELEQEHLTASRKMVG